MNRHPLMAKEASVARTARAPGSRSRQAKQAQARIHARAAKLPPPTPASAKALETESAVRQDKIKRAKRLLQNAHYPTDEVIESVADLLARNLRRNRGISAGSAG